MVFYNKMLPIINSKFKIDSEFCLKNEDQEIYQADGLFNVSDFKAGDFLKFRSKNGGIKYAFVFEIEKLIMHLRIMDKSVYELLFTKKK